MAFEPTRNRPSHATGILLLVAALVLVALTLCLLAGPVVALAASSPLAAALVLTLAGRRQDQLSSRDAETGLPDRAAALLRLEEITTQSATAKRQAAVVIAALSETAFATAEDRRSTLLLAALRMAQRLRKGDQILRVGTSSLAVILGPSRGLNARSARDILDRLDGVLREPFRLGDRTLDVESALGACLQHDAPAGEARAWLEAAEDAAGIAATKREPHVYWLARTSAGAARWQETATEDTVANEARSA